MDTMQTLLAVFTAIFGSGTIGMTLLFFSANRRLKEAEARKAENMAEASRIDNFDKATDATLDLARQLLEIVNDKTERIRKMGDDILLLKEDLHSSEMKYICARCDRLDCSERHPPFPWQEQKL